MKDAISQIFFDHAPDDADLGDHVEDDADSGHHAGSGTDLLDLPEDRTQPQSDSHDQFWADAESDLDYEAALDADHEEPEDHSPADESPNHGYDPGVTVVQGYAPGADPVEITIFSPMPDTMVDVDLQQSHDGTGTEVHIGGHLRAVLAGVTPYDVDPTDLMIEYAG